jgi:hypothetical protein
VLIAVLASALAQGCSASHEAGPAFVDGGSDGRADAGTGHEAGDAAAVDEMGEAGDEAPCMEYSGTMGKACVLDSDCDTACGSPGYLCSNDPVYMGALGDEAVFPSPVCVPTAACNPLANGAGQLAFCGGDAADPASPGVCVPDTSPPEADMGTCYPQCNFKADGSAATGCVGKDVCRFEGYGWDSSGNLLGIGVCYGGCVTDADCSASGAKTQHCNTLYGVCTSTVMAPTEPMGAGCNGGGTTSPCFCASNESNNLGFCSTFCIQGGTECPSGWICDLSLPTTVTSAADASVSGFTQDNPGLSGFCAPACSVDGGMATGTDSGACPPNATCQAGDVGGPDCLPLQ